MSSSDGAPFSKVEASYSCAKAESLVGRPAAALILSLSLSMVKCEAATMAADSKNMAATSQNAQNLRSARDDALLSQA